MKKKGLLCIAVTAMVLAALLATSIFVSADSAETKALTLAVPETMQAESPTVYTFTPAATGAYIFRSYTDYAGYVDPYCTLYNGAEYIARSDDEAGNMQFKLRAYLEKDVTYTLDVKTYQADGYINVIVEEAPEIVSAELASPSYKTEYYVNDFPEMYDFSGLALRYTFSDDTEAVWDCDRGPAFEGMEVTMNYDRMNEEGIVVISCGGYDFEYEVTMIETEAESIVISPSCKQLQNYERSNGYLTAVNGEDVYEYSLYEVLGNVEITVYYNDGSHETYTYSLGADGYSFKSRSEVPTYEWVKGGQYAVTVNYQGKTDTLTVEIVENPVASVEVVESSVRYPIEGADLVAREMMDPETGEWITHYEYNVSKVYENALIQLNYKDGTHGIFRFDEKPLGNAVYVDSPNQYYYPWTVGGQNMTRIYYMDFKIDKYIPLLSNPVDSIEVLEDTVGTLKEYTNGGYNYYYDHENDREECFFRYNLDSAFENTMVKVTYVGGDSETYPISNVLNGYAFEIIDAQGREYDEWSVGGENPVTVRFMGKTDTLSMVMEGSGIESLTVVESTLPVYIENMGGEMTEIFDNESGQYVDFYFYYINPIIEQAQIRVDYTDGSHEILYVFELDREPGFELTHNQFVSHWTVGGNNTITVKYKGKTAEAVVTVVENPVLSLEVVEGTVPEIVEKTNGWYETVETQNGTEQIFRYDISDIFENARIKINYRNGTHEIVDRDTDLGGDYRIEFTTEQELEPWTIGGENKVIISFMGIETEYSVVLTESPVDRIEVDRDTVPAYYEGLDGSFETIYDEETGEPDEIFIYDTENIRENIMITVYMKDGSSETVSFYEQFNGMEFYYDDTQYSTPWTLGTENYFTLTFGGKSVNVSVEIAENPIDRIEAVEGTVGRIIENTNGYIDYYYDPEAGEPVEFYYYETSNILREVQFKVYLKDGTDFIVTPDGYSTYSNQYESPWTLGGNNILEVEFKIPDMTYVRVELAVEIIENPVESIEIVDGTLGYHIENSDGDWEYYYDENDQRVDFYYYYMDRIIQDVQIKVNFKDGTHEIINFGESLFDLYPDYTSDQYDDPWTVGGDNMLIISFMGKEAAASVEVRESPVSSIEVIAKDGLVLYENTDGHTDSSSGEEFFYYYTDRILNTIKLKVTFDNGTTETIGVRDRLNGFSVSWNYDQEEEHWGVGKDNVMVFEFMGAEAEYRVNIVPSPVESIEVVDGTAVKLVENIYGETISRWDDELDREVEFFCYYVGIVTDSIKLKINFTDGTHVIASPGDVVNGYRVYYDERQYDEPWGVGKDNNIVFEYMDKSVEYSVEIVKPYITGITVDTLGIDSIYMNDLDNGYYNEGEYWLSPMINGLVFTVSYENSSPKTFTSADIDEDGRADGYPVYLYSEEKAVFGENTLYFEYMGEIVEVKVEVVESPVESIELTALPDKTEYEYNNTDSDYTFAPIMDGIDFEITYANGDTERFSEIVTGFTMDWDSYGPIYMYEVADGGCFYIQVTENDTFVASYKGAECEINCFEFTEGKAIDGIEIIDIGENGKDMTVKVIYDDKTTVILETAAISHYEIETGSFWAGLAQTEKGIVMYYHSYSDGMHYVEILGESVEFSDEETDYIVGDTDGDEKVGTKDAIYLLYAIMFAGDEDYALNQECDFNGDGRVTTSDAIYLLYHVMFGAAEYPLG